nr:anaerobic ribonucleoside-triphosphate reductase activating protein [Pelovirga terrestris]
MKPISIKGFQGTSLLDFPGRVASLVFTGGCNLTCPFCHNGGLVLEPDGYPDIPLDELLADLKARRNFIDGVVVSGGEPTIEAGLPAFLAELKRLDLQVKLDTNGLLPKVIAHLLEHHLLDYIAVDIKTSPERYSELHSVAVDPAGLIATVELLSQVAIEVEYRTTCIPGLVTRQEIDAIGDLLRGAPLWVLQQYVAEHAMDTDWQGLEKYPPEQLQQFAAGAQEYVQQVQVRGI